MGVNAFNLLDCGVNNSALVGVHRVKNNVSAVLENLCGVSLCKLTERFGSLFTVVADVD